MIGYGAVGRSAAAVLADRGDAVRIVQRHEPRELPNGCTFHAADWMDREATIGAAAGVDTVVCCLGFPYDSALWRRVWPTTMANLIDGCSASGARLVFADNLYMYGPQTSPLAEDMPLTNFGRKPAIRAEVTNLWKSAHDAGRLRAVAVRASDFYGPDAPTSVVSAFGVARGRKTGADAVFSGTRSRFHEPRLCACSGHACGRAGRCLWASLACPECADADVA